jgi:thioredoxin reductase
MSLRANASLQAGTGHGVRLADCPRLMPKSRPANGKLFDCVIVGGGASGLSCALLLARHLRNVLVVQSGSPRNFAAERVNGLLSRHGVSPTELLHVARQEAANAGALFVEGKVTSILRVQDTFRVSIGQQEVTASRVVLAYGVKDTIPTIHGAEALYGRGVFHCPTCDGFEVAGKTVVALGAGEKVVSLALELLHWARWVKILTNGKPPFGDPAARAKLADNKIETLTDPITKVLCQNDRFSGVELTGSKTLEAEGLFFVLGSTRSSKLAEDLGCAIDAEEDTIQVNDQCETTVRGIYAIGDVTAGPQLVAKAAADGVIAAISIHRSLLPSCRVLKSA